jgi:signal transduction histidine kinase
VETEAIAPQNVGGPFNLELMDQDSGCRLSIGHMMFMMARYTEALLPDGSKFPVCIVLGGPSDARRHKEPGSKPGAAILPMQGRARLVVRDEGIGITPAALERIFSRFERAVLERNYGGLGLGLYVTRQIVQTLGGTVRAESTPGQGATLPWSCPSGLEAAEAGQKLEPSCLAATVLWHGTRQESADGAARRTPSADRPARPPCAG